MPRFDKWLTDVGPEAPIPRAARKAIASRLRAVEHFLREAAQVSGNADEDTEAVHQLRVWTRRAAAALRLFQAVLPRRPAKWLRRKLRRMRRTAGEARDCDVLAGQLASGDVPSLAHAGVHLRQRRAKAERKLAALYKTLVRSEKLQRKAARLRDRARWRGRKRSPKFGPWCREQLGPLCEAFFELAAGDLAQNEALHELRLSGKRLRYALELAPAAIPAGQHRRLYDELSDLQDRLGGLCDAMVAVERLQQLQDETQDRALRKELQAAATREARQLAARKTRLLRWWSRKRQQQMRRGWEKALRG